ncbi:MAG: hypothetical protein LUF29_09340 [Oscillospiraceae bacterium]|nr:hypothetical protein [Oscillospiraceae bacterium]
MEDDDIKNYMNFGMEVVLFGKEIRTDEKQKISKKHLHFPNSRAIILPQFARMGFAVVPGSCSR